MKKSPLQAEHEADTGEDFHAAVLRLAAEGKTLTEAALVLGYAHCASLSSYLSRKAPDLQFYRKPLKPKRKPVLRFMCRYKERTGRDLFDDIRKLVADGLNASQIMKAVGAPNYGITGFKRMVRCNAPDIEMKNPKIGRPRSKA